MWHEQRQFYHSKVAGTHYIVPQSGFAIRLSRTEPNKRIFVFHIRVVCWHQSSSREPRSLEDWIEQYEDYLRIERNVSPHTLRNYLSDLRRIDEAIER